MPNLYEEIFGKFEKTSEELIKDSRFDKNLGLNMAEDARRLSRGEITDDEFVNKYQESVQREFKQKLQVASAETASSSKKKHKWVMVIDLRKCVGCETCTVSCKAENLTPPGVTYNQVMIEEVGSFPNVSRVNIPRPCMHCDKPPCVSVCPVRATYKSEDGIVVQDNDRCIGCRYCMVACPYGARSFDFGLNYDEMLGYGTVTAPDHGMDRGERTKGSPVGTVRKCTFCFHRLNRGEEPACVETCIGDARFFGDINDPNSVVSKMASSARAFRLKEEYGTEPSVYYLR